MFDALGSIMFSGLFMGIWSSQLPNYEKGQQAVKKVMHLLRSMNPLPQISDHGGVTVGAGEIEFRNVTFYYPSRPTTAILKNFNIKIKAGL
jgi:ABC-type multidrug transport system fused ATPase/permease subunit